MKLPRYWPVAILTGALVVAALAGCGSVDRYTIHVNMSTDPKENPSPAFLNVKSREGAQRAWALSGQTSLVRWQNDRTDTLRLIIPIWPFEEPEREIVIAPGAASPFFKFARGRGKTFDWDADPLPDRPPGEPAIVDGP